MELKFREILFECKQPNFAEFKIFSSRSLATWYIYVQLNLCIVVTLGPTFYGCNIEGGCIIEVHNTLATCTLGPNKVALLERLAAL